MADDVVDIAEIWPACIAELEDRLYPVNYRDLTELALSRLGLTREAVNWSRQIEDVRERFAKGPKHKREVGYTGPPSYLAFLQSWVRRDLQHSLLNNEKAVSIVANFPSSEEACFEALMRAPTMLTKTATSRVRRIRGLARGMLIQEHVTEYFRSRWPEYYHPPENDQQWDRWSDHDFKLVMGVKLWKVDVLGEHLEGGYGLARMKRAVDIHVLAKLAGNRLVIEGFCRGKALQQLQDFNWWDSSPIQPLLVYLNCQKAGIDYAELRRPV